MNAKKVRLSPAPLHLVERLDALAAHFFADVVEVQALRFQVLLHRLALLDENQRLSLDHELRETVT